MSNEVLERFQKFLRERKGGPAVDKQKLAELLDAFEAGTKFGIDQAFKTLRGSRAQCPHGMPLAENVCGPCSEGRPNNKPATEQTSQS